MIEEVERRALALMTIGGFQQAMAEDPSQVELPDPDEMRRKFDEWLISEPERIDPKTTEERELLEALGM